MVKEIKTKPIVHTLPYNFSRDLGGATLNQMEETKYIQDTKNFIKTKLIYMHKFGYNHEIAS